MKRREMLFLVSGLVLGLVFGMILIGSDDSLRESIFGTAGSVRKADVAYYLVNLDDAQSWLLAEYPQNSEELKAAFASLPACCMSVRKTPSSRKAWSTYWRSVSSLTCGSAR